MPLFGKRNRAKQIPLTLEDNLRIMDLVESGWVRIAAAAWQGYDGYGRGFLFMDFVDNETKYVPASNPNFAASRDLQRDDIKRKVKAYDPQTELVLVLHNFVSGSQTAMQVPTSKGMPTPLEAYRQFFGAS